MQTLPLPVELLPETVRRFGDPKALGPAKMMAARGLVPVKGGDLVTLLCQLSVDEDPTVSDAARSTLDKMPKNVLKPACASPLHPAVLDLLSERFRNDDEVLETIVLNKGVLPATIAGLARACSESISELIAVNQELLLAHPVIIESLYKNKKTRMSTADRLIELAARNGVTLQGIHSFQAHVEAIQGQLIPEPTNEPLPSDESFAEALIHDDSEDAIEIDKADGTESVKEQFKPLMFRIRDMNVAEKIRLSIVGDAAARAILVRDPNRLVCTAAISSPSMTLKEASDIAQSREIGEDILRYIGGRREWLRSYEIKRGLVFNPKTPIGISMRFLTHMRLNDLKAISKSRNVAPAIKNLARQQLEKRQKKT